VNPGAIEIVGNGIDDDCDPSTSDTTSQEALCSEAESLMGVTGGACPSGAGANDSVSVRLVIRAPTNVAGFTFQRRDVVAPRGGAPPQGRDLRARIDGVRCVRRGHG